MRLARFIANCPLILAGALLMQNCQAQEAHKKMPDLVQQVLEKEPAATLTAKEIGPSANTELIKLTRNDDAKVRRIAVYCLEETGGADAAVAFARLTLDDDSQVRAAALDGLFRHQADVVPEIEKRYQAEKDPQAKEGLVVALSERGDTRAQAEFLQGLQGSRNRDRARYLDYAGKIKAKWLLPGLLPILDDKTPLVWIGVDGRPDLPQSLRACDIAVNLIAEITGHKFSFPIAGNVNYTEEQIAEVKAL